ncbi:MAG TPA: cation diffusion facilitator family transporter [Candidatus Cloacimonadota bacterium]|nr:cation diffusion facilitator family transporter [Candidatus Cloacimonadota bacterium]
MTEYRTRIGYLQALLSIILNILLFALKMWAGIKSASIAIIADAWHTLSDSLSSLVLLFGFKISSKPADEKHPFGHGRAEIIATVIVGILLVIVGFSFFTDAIQKLRAHQAANFGTLAYVATIVSIVLKEAMAQFAIYFGKKCDSELLLADGWHHRSDALSSVAVLIGIFLGKLYWWVDGCLGILIALLLFKAAYDILKHSISKLIGEEPSEALINSITSLISSQFDEPVHFHHLHVHNYGDHREVTFHIMMNPQTSLQKAHDLTDKIENLLRDEMKIEATIHAEPYLKNKN